MTAAQYYKSLFKKKPASSHENSKRGKKKRSKVNQSMGGASNQLIYHDAKLLHKAFPETRNNNRPKS